VDDKQASALAELVSDLATMDEPIQPARIRSIWFCQIPSEYG
jgi:hypothetical protein